MATKASIQKLVDEKSESVTLQDPKGTFTFLQYVFALYLHTDRVKHGASAVGYRATQPSQKLLVRWDIGNRTLRTQDSSDPRHFGTTLVGPKCPDTLDPPK